MLLITSTSTGELVGVTGSRGCPAPGRPLAILGSSGALNDPGVQSAKVSPISDCGRIVQWASLWKGEKPDLLMLRTTAAFLSGVTSSDSILPTFAPAIFTSSPGTARTKSKIARTL